MDSGIEERVGLDGQRLHVQRVDRAGGGLTLDDHVHLHGDLLAAADQQQVEVLDLLGEHVALDVLHQGELALAVEGQLEQGVDVVLDDQEGLVARQGEVRGRLAVAVEHRGDLVVATDAARRTLAELGAQGGGNVLSHGGSSSGAM